jgi:hypothetical protein
MCNGWIRDGYFIKVRDVFARQTDPPPTPVYRYDPTDEQEDRSPSGELKRLNWLRNQLRFENRKLPIGRSVRTTLYVPTEKTVRETGGAMPGLENAAHGVMVNEIILTAGEKLLTILDEETFEGSGTEPDFDSLQPCGVGNFGPGWRGEAWLKANGISCNGYYPDLARVLRGRIVYAADYSRGYEYKRLAEIRRRCVECGVNYSIWG